MGWQEFHRELNEKIEGKTKEPTTMIAKQSVYLTADRSKAVPEGDKDARFLLVREGHDISDGEADKYDGAASLIGKARSGPSVDESRPALNLASDKPAKVVKAPKAKRAPKAKK